jgi:predicted metal-binding protein
MHFAHSDKPIQIKEAKGFVEIVSKYAKSLVLVQGYDEQNLQEIVQTKEQKFMMENYDE